MRIVLIVLLVVAPVFLPGCSKKLRGIPPGASSN